MNPISPMEKVPSSNSDTRSTSGWKLYLFVLLILLAETTALSLLKQYSLSQNVVYLLGGLACYTLVSLFLVQSFRYEGMGIVNVLWSAFSVILVVAAGIVFFGESISKIESLGIAMVIIGVGILRLPVSKKVRGGQCLHVVSSDVPSLT